jgi:hypothetical protein
MTEGDTEDWSESDKEDCDDGGCGAGEESLSPHEAKLWADGGHRFIGHEKNKWETDTDIDARVRAAPRALQPEPKPATRRPGPLWSFACVARMSNVVCACCTLVERVTNGALDILRSVSHRAARG